MQMKFWLATKAHGKKIKILVSFLFIIITIISPSCFAGDVPIERDFLRLPGQRWIWLEKLDWHSTRIILGKGKKTFKNKIWSETYESNGERHTWEYAFFIRITPKQFITLDTDNNPNFAISTYDMGNGLIRWAIIYRVKENKLEIVKEIDGFNVAADESIFKKAPPNW